MSITVGGDLMGRLNGSDLMGRLNGGSLLGDFRSDLLGRLSETTY